MRALGALALILALTACGGSSGDDLIEEASATCKEEAENVVETGNALSEAMGGQATDAEATDLLRMENGSLLVEVPGELGFSIVECVLNRLDAPGSVAQRMGNATAASGEQSASWDDIAASWSYDGSLLSATFDPA